MTDEPSNDIIAKIDHGVKDENGDLDPNAPNPVNPTPHDNADCPEPKPTSSKIESLPPACPVSVQSPHMTRPPETGLIRIGTLLSVPHDGSQSNAMVRQCPVTSRGCF